MFEWNDVSDPCRFSQPVVKCILTLIKKWHFLAVIPSVLDCTWCMYPYSYCGYRCVNTRSCGWLWACLHLSGLAFAEATKIMHRRERIYSLCGNYCLSREYCYIILSHFCGVHDLSHPQPQENFCVFCMEKNQPIASHVSTSSRRLLWAKRCFTHYIYSSK